MTSSTFLLVMSVVSFFVVTFAGTLHYRRQMERMKRGKEILNRYSPERNRKPQGL
jgi:hypothetical protein